MSRLVLAVVALLAASPRAPGDDAGVTYRGADGPGAGRTIVLVSGDEEYRSEEALPQLGRILGVHHGFTCRVLFAVDPATGVIDPDVRTNIPGLGALTDADLLVIATRFRDLPDEQMRHIDAYVRSGRPVVGLRTATHAFALGGSETFRRYSWNHDGPDYPQGFGRQVLGETWIAHHGRHGIESTRGVVAPGAETHPIVRGITDASIWGPTDVYRVRLPLPDGCTPIVLGQILAGMTPDAAPIDDDRNDPMMPVAWTRTRPGPAGPQRVFATTMGAATDLETAGTRRMIVQGVYWALGMEDDIPRGGADVALVGPYEPTPFGFGGFRRGVRPADHAWPPPADADADDVPRSGGRPLRLEPGASVVVVGNTFAERLAASGVLDAVAHAAHPGHGLQVRHVPWSGDEVGLRPREKDVPTMEDWIRRFDADVVVMCFGMSESFTAVARGRLETDLRALVAALRSSPGPDGGPRRLVLVAPIAREHLGPPWPSAGDVAAHNDALADVTDAMRRVARSEDLRLVDLFAFSRVAYASSPAPLTTNGIHPSAVGCAVFAGAIARDLGWIGAPPDAAPAGPATHAADTLLTLARDKHEHERLRYRPTNTEYIWGRRKEPYGVVNFPPEMTQLDRMIAARERAMGDVRVPASAVLARAAATPFRWSPGLPRPSLPDDAWTPAPVEAKGTETSLGRLDIDDPATFAASFTLPPDYVVSCFASEQDFPELANPLAMAFDDRGRLWVLCTPTYPHLRPGAAPQCVLLILEDETGDGRADRRTVFVDGLNIPTGFAIDVDAVYVGQAPDLLRFADTDGDDRADVREVVLSGFGMCDSHHQISAFEWEPSGGFLMHEGVFTKSNVETPFGTRRTNGAGVWRYDPRTGRLDVLSHCNFANPWGHAFDDFGASILADASNGNNHGFSHVSLPFEYPHKPAKAPHVLHRGRPTAGCEIIASRHFPDDVQGSYLVNQSIGFHGTRWDRLSPAGSAWSASAMPQDLVASSDTNFRPVAMEIGPDGALYVVDWCNPIVGHMQYSVRDPRRDHAHGRVWRVRHRDRALVTPPDVHDASIGALLELLRLPERNTRQLARRRLQRADWAAVRPALTTWSAGLDPADPLYDRLVVEDLWIRHAHGHASLDHIERALTLGDARARAAAVRVLRHRLQAHGVDPRRAAALLTRAVEDDDMRVRLEGVVACGFLPPRAGLAIAARADLHDMDDAMHVVFEEILSYLGRGGDVVSEALERVRLARMPEGELLAQPLTEMTATVRLARADLPRARHAEALAFLAGADPQRQADRLVTVLASARGDEAVHAAGRLLLSMPADTRAGVAGAARGLVDGDDPARRAVGAAVLLGLPGADDPDLEVAVVVDAVALMDAGQASGDVLSRIRAAVTAGVVDPAPAIGQVARHGGDDPVVRKWLADLADAVADEGFEPWLTTHERAMPALRALARLEDDGARVAAAAPSRLETGRALYLDEAVGCARCHGVRGQGLEGFPPLDRSPWVLGDARRAASIVLYGLYGRIRMPDGRTFDSVMAPLGAGLDDEQVAAILTYVRQSWGNFAEPVTAVQVAEARAAGVARGGPWETRALLNAYPLWRDALVPASASVTASSWLVWIVRQVVVYLVPPLAAAAAILLLLSRSSRTPAMS